MLSLPYLDWMNVQGATIATTDPVLPCGPVTQAYQSVWFRYTPDSSGEVVLSTYSSGYDTVLAVWSGIEGNLTNIACNNDARGATSLLALDLNGGSTYYIEVTKFGTAAPTDYWLYLNLVQVGDDFDVPFLLNPSLPSTTTLNTNKYSSFLDDPDFTACNVIGANSVWYKFVPSQNGTLNVNTVGSSYDTVLGVWSGDRGALTPWPVTTIALAISLRTSPFPFQSGTRITSKWLPGGATSIPCRMANHLLQKAWTPKSNSMD